MEAGVWFIFGLGLGVILVGFVALGSYSRGYENASREPFRAELRARRLVANAQARDPHERAVA